MLGEFGVVCTIVPALLDIMFWKASLFLRLYLMLVVPSSPRLAIKKVSLALKLQ